MRRVTVGVVVRDEATIRRDAIFDITDERRKQDEQWGESNHDPIIWSTILAKHVGRLNDYALKWLEESGYDSEEVHAIMDFRDQALKVAALGLAIMECIDREKWAK